MIEATGLREGIPSGRSLALPASLSPRVAVAALLAVALTMRVIVALVLPPWQSPDEPKHFEYIRLLVDKRAELWAERRLLQLADVSPQLQLEIIASLARHHYWEYRGVAAPPTMPGSFFDLWGGTGTQLHRPSLYYVLGAVVLAPLRAADLELQLLAVRLFSAVLSTLTVAVTYLAARKLAPSDGFVSMVSAAFVAALPMHVFIGGAVNNDNLLSLLGALVALGLASGFRHGFGLGRWAFILGALALAFATKRAAVGLLPAVALAATFWLASLRGRRLRVALAALVAGVGLALIGASTEAVGRALSLDRLSAAWAAYTLNEPDQLDKLARAPLAAPETRALVASHLANLFRSFWGVFGWYTLPLSDGLYLVLALISASCGLGLLAWLLLQIRAQTARPGRPDAPALLTSLVYLVLIGAMVVLAIGERLAYLSPGEIPQGRTLFVAVSAIAVAYALGARAVLPRRRFGTTGPALVCTLALVALDLHVYVWYVLPFYVARALP